MMMNNYCLMMRMVIIIIVLVVMNDVLDGNMKDPKVDEFVVHFTIIIFNRV